MLRESDQHFAHSLHGLLRCPLFEVKQGREHFVCEHFIPQVSYEIISTTYSRLDGRIEIKGHTMLHEFNQRVAYHLHSLVSLRALTEHAMQTLEHIGFEHLIPGVIYEHASTTHCSSDHQIQTDDRTMFRESDQSVAHCLHSIARAPPTKHMKQGGEHFALEHSGPQGIYELASMIHSRLDCSRGQTIRKERAKGTNGRWSDKVIVMFE